MNKFAECPIEKRQTATFAACRRCGVISGPDDWLRPCNLAPRARGVPVAIFQLRVGLAEVRAEIFRGSVGDGVWKRIHARTRRVALGATAVMVPRAPRLQDMSRRRALESCCT
jgi:hypothetical protein